MFNLRYPIIGAPMFLVSNVDMVVAMAEGGILGTMPSLNFRPADAFKKALRDIKSRTQGAIGINIIVNKANSRQSEDLRAALDAGVELLITSLGNPKEVIRQAHQVGTKVFCDVTNLAHAKKVADLGADGVVAVAHGAGGHAGPISPLVLIPWLKTELKIPVLAAGGIATGAQMAACLALGADGIYVGTRFIASKEAQVEKSYKDAIVRSTPEDIVMTTRVSGTPAAVINTDYVKKVGTDLPLPLVWLKNHPKTKNIVTPLIHWMGMRDLETAAKSSSWKEVWSAGQSVGLIDDILPISAIIKNFVDEYKMAMARMPQTIF